MTTLTANQAEAMTSLNGYVGKTVEVLTSGYTANVSADFVARAVGGTMSRAALRGLEKKGFIRIEGAYWKGATVTVLKAADI